MTRVLILAGWTVQVQLVMPQMRCACQYQSLQSTHLPDHNWACPRSLQG